MWKKVNNSNDTTGEFNGLLVQDAYLISGNIRAIGLAEINNRQGITLAIEDNTEIEITFYNAIRRKFVLPSGNHNIPKWGSLRLNYETGQLLTLWEDDPYNNQIQLLRVGVDETGLYANEGTGSEIQIVVGGFLMKYFYPFGKEVASVVTPKRVTRIVQDLGGLQSCNFINGELWTFDKESNSGKITMWNPETLESLNYVRGLNHWNSTDYNSNIDCIVTVNDWDISEGDTSFAIYYDVSTWRNKPNTFNVDTQPDDGTHYVNIDFSNYGEGPQPFWGEDNDGQNNIVYVVTDSCVQIHQLLLGKGSHHLEGGIFIPGMPEDKFNGTWKRIGYWTQIHGAGRIQDGFYYNGAIYSAKDPSNDGFNQGGMLVYKMELLSDGRIKNTKIQVPTYDADGNLIDFNGWYSGGCTLRDDGKVWMLQTSDETSKIFIFDVV